MKTTVLLFVISLLVFCETKGPHRVFVQPGEDLLLQVNTLVYHTTSTDFDWRLVEEAAIFIVKVRGKDISITKRYKDRAVLKENNTLILRNLQLSDSGTYRAVLSDDSEHTLAEYNVIVQDPVSPVNLTVSLKSNSSDCILNTSCIPEDSHTSFTFTCDVKNCSRRSEVNPSGSIIVFVQQDHIICNYSNQVSWKQDKVDISAFCGERSKPHVSDRDHDIAVAVGIAVGGCVLLAIMIYLCQKKYRGNKEHQAPRQNSAEEASSSSPTTTYAMVEFSPRPAESNACETASKPETLYATVNKANYHRYEPADEDE